MTEFDPNQTLASIARDDGNAEQSGYLTKTPYDRCGTQGGQIV